MAKFGKAGPLLEGTAYGVLNEILSEFRSGDGFARPSRYEVLIQPPNGFAGEGRNELKNTWGLIMNDNSGDGTVRRTSLRCSQVSFPGRTLQTQQDTNIYGPTRNVVQGYEFAELQAQFQLSTDLREKTLDGQRADGRDSKTVRKIDIEASILPRTHGSCLFTRGETQAIVVTTLGNKRDEQMIDNLEGLSYRNLMLHYNFPPYSVGEVRRMFNVSRREVGHGNLALRAIKPSMPNSEIFPYTVRLVSEITESNGSSSMATVCGSTLALMDAGVPIKKPIAGIAMGLIMESKDRYAILTDILGTEDHLGDMDFKVAGSDEGITAIQMDLKIDGLPIDILKEALDQAKEGRLHILEEMKKCLSEPRKNMSEHAPKMLMTTVPVEKIGLVIGPQGKNIKALCADYECDLNVEEDGRCVVSGLDQEKLEQAIKVLEGYSFVPKVNEIYSGKVVKIMDFGAFVRIAPDVDGLVHISEIQNERTNKVEDILKVDQEVDVKLIKKDDKGRLSLSMKAVKSEK